MKKRNTVIVVVVIVVLAVVAYLVFHKSDNTSSNNNNPSVSQQNNTQAANNKILTTKTASGVGQYLADSQGKPLYTYNGDTSGVSNCTGSCLANWPAYQASGSKANLPTDVSTIKRSDNGQTQYTYKGLPLYYFTGDTSGQPTGNGVENFSIATPSSNTSPQSTPAPTPTPPTNSNPYNYQ